MPRIAPLEPPYAPQVRATFHAIMRGAPPLILFRALAARPRAWVKFRGFYRMVAYVANGLDLPLEAAAARFPA